VFDLFGAHGGRLPLSSTSVYLRVLEKSNRGQFSGKKLSVYAGARADANFVRSSARGQFGMLNGEFYLSVDSLLTRKG
jgi:hypothetical protein